MFAGGEEIAVSELARNCGRAGGYRATTAHALAYERASRPKPAKLAVNLKLRGRVEEDLRRRYSPEQIVGRLRPQFADDLEMRGSAARTSSTGARSQSWRSGSSQRFSVG